MSWHAKHRIYIRVFECKEDIIFGSATLEGKKFKADPEFQDARKLMYGFG